jgi:hypothetical protein
VVLLALPGAAGAQQTGTLTAADRADIQQLSARYAETLAACAASDYAGLFAADGYFASGFRGRVQGADKLVELVRSERHCTGAGSRPVGAVPTAEVKPAAKGAVGHVPLPNDGGAYEDVYVKTAHGWRFQSRTYFTTKELAARTESAAAPH